MTSVLWLAVSGGSLSAASRFAASRYRVRFPTIHMAQLNLIVYQVWSMYQTDKVKDNLKILRYLAKFARAAFKAWFLLGM